MALGFGEIISLGMFCIAVMTFSWGVVKFFNNQTHARITKVKEDMDRRVDHLEENMASRQELSNSVDMVKDMVKTIKDENHRMAQRLDDFVKWVMEMNKKSG